MVLGKLPMPGRPTILITVGQGPIALAVGAGGGGLDIFTLIYPFSSFSLSSGDGSILTEILSQRAVKPKTTNQPTNTEMFIYSFNLTAPLPLWIFFFCLSTKRVVCELGQEFRGNDVLSASVLSQSRPRGYKFFSCLTQLSMDFFLRINIKMPTTVGMLIFMSTKNSILGLSESKNAEFMGFFFILTSI